MASILAKILTEGDKHFSSKNYGGHKDYPKETLYYANMIKEIIKTEGITHYLNAGDFSYGRFDKLEYRAEIDKILKELNELTNGNVWFLKGNHDSASYGTTEFEYYAAAGAFKTSENLDFALGTPGGGLHIEMKDFGDFSKFNGVTGAFNLLITHGYFTFDKENTVIKPQLVLAEHADWADVDMILCGHIHSESFLRGKGYGGKPIAIHYLPCLSRPAYIRDGMADDASVDIITVYDDGTVNLEQHEIKLLPLEVSFDIAAIMSQDQKSEESQRVAIDVSDIAKKMEDHVRVMSDPVVAIESSNEIPNEVKQIAVELIKAARG